MSKLFRIFVGFSVLTLASAAALFGQDQRLASAAGDKYVISAKAGGVNYVEGKVSVLRRDGRGRLLLARDEVEVGDRVTTAANGRAEVLLNPGSYLRIGGGTSFDFVSTSLDDLKLNLYGGNAMFEIIADDDFRVSVQTPSGQIHLTRSGVYRIDVPADGEARVSVIKGKLFLGPSTEVKAGRTAVIKNDSAAVAKFDKKNKDELEVWSKIRAKELAQTNSRLQRRGLRDTLLTSFNSRGWNLYNSFGLWVYDPFRLHWCFLPFGSGWGSPYGYYYGSDIWGFGMPRWIYYQPNPVPPSGTAPSQPKDTVGRQPDNGDTHGRIRPPYKQIENNERGGGEGIVNRRIGLPREDSSWNPSIPSAEPSRSIPSSPPSAATAPIRAIPRSESKERPQ